MVARVSPPLAPTLRQWPAPPWQFCCCGGNRQQQRTTREPYQWVRGEDNEEKPDRRVTVRPSPWRCVFTAPCHRQLAGRRGW
jgi:hypothetical protein